MNDSTARSSVVEAQHHVSQLFTRGLIVRLCTMFAIHAVAADDMFAPDNITYHHVSAALAAYWSGDLLLYPWQLEGGRQPLAYFYVTGILYYVFGPYPLVPKLVNALVGAYTIRLSFDLALAASGSAAVGLRTARYVTYFPSLILWSSIGIRDCWVVLLLLYVTLQALRLQESFALGVLVRFAGAILLLTQFRAYLLFAVVGPLAVSFLVARRGNVLRNTLLGMAAAGLLIYADALAGNQSARALDLQTLSDNRRWSAQVSSSGFAEDVDISTPDKALAFLPVGLFYFVFAPFPWTLVNLRQGLTLPEMLFYYTLIPAVVVGTRTLLRERLAKALPLVLITTGLSLGYAIGQGNVGTMYRHRAQILPSILLLAAVGKEVQHRAVRARTLTPAASLLHQRA